MINKMNEKFEGITEPHLINILIDKHQVVT